MRINICLVSNDQGANDTVRQNRIGLIPKNQREHHRMRDIGAEFSINTYNPNTAGRSLAQYLMEEPRDQVIVILLDTSLGAYADDIASACFIAEVEFSTYPETNYKNYFASVLSLLLKRLAIFIPFISDGANAQAMLLPFRNFKAQDLCDLRETCRKESLSLEFNNKVVSLVENLKNRRRRHRKANYPDLHYVDDDEKLFHYGPERHSSIETGAPHTFVCILTGNFRFGKRIPTDLHYNVTKEFKQHCQIEGKFTGCHDDIHIVASKTHLNIFSNDLIA